MSSSNRGMIFNMQQFSVHDGSGIRTVVFLKGCPLKCRWCSNPESQKREPQMAFNKSRCLTVEKCTRCVTACPQEGICGQEDGHILMDTGRCISCFSCASACPADALKVYGEEKTAKEILDHVEKDALFYQRSGGGITISGGEAMAQPEFTLSLLQESRKRRIHSAMETTCFCKWDDLRAVCETLDQMICDIKHMDDDAHITGTGVSNKLILENITKMIEHFPDLPVTIRTPVIPGFNDTVEAIQAIADFIPRRKRVTYELLPFHPYGENKYLFLGMENPYQGVQFDENRMIVLNEVSEQFNNDINNL